MNIKVFEESDRPPRVIEIFVHGNYITAELHYGRHTLSAWMIDAGEDAIGFFKIMPDSKLFPIVVIKETYLINPHNSKANGNLMRAFLEEISHEARNVTVVSQEHLIELLVSWGFNNIGDGPVMILNNY